MDWDTDRGLQVRMGLAVALVLALSVAFVYAFVYAVNTVGLDLLAWAAGVLSETRPTNPRNGRVYVEPWLVAGAVAVGFALQVLFGQRVALRSIGAHRVDRESDPELVDRVDRLARQADVPRPDVGVSTASAPNAFTVGFRPSSATVVVTNGLLGALDGDELDAVIAHELAHVKNRGVAVMSLAYFLPSLTYIVAIAAAGLLKTLFFVPRRFYLVDDDDAAKGLVVGFVVLVVSTVVTLAIAALFWLASFTLFRVLAQYREFAADRGAAAITGDPAALATALRTIDDEMGSVADRDLRRIDGGLEGLYVAPIEDTQFGSHRELISSDIFPATHPSTEERVERLRELAGETA